MSQGFIFSVSPCISLALISDLLTQLVAFLGYISKSPGPRHYYCLGLSGPGSSWLHYLYPRVMDSPVAVLNLSF